MKQFISWSLFLSAALAASCGGSGGSGGGGTVSIGSRSWQDLNGNGLQEAGEPGLAGLPVTLKRKGQVVATTTTDASGDYNFSGRAAGSYTVEVATPGTFVPALELVGNDPALDSNLSPANISLAGGSSNLETDFGFSGTGSIGDRVWVDENCNGLQDAGEGDLDDVVVVLKDERGFSRDTLTVNGFYLFTNLSAGTYTVWVDDAALAPILTPTLCNVGTDPELDSECSPATVVLADDETRLSGIDFGYCPLGTGAIGDRVWHDLNLNGLQDPGEPGIAKVAVFLQDTAGGLLMKAQTNAKGFYAFKGLPPGDYVLDLFAPNCFMPTLCDVGKDDTIDSECGPVAVTVTAGVYDDTVDFGFVPAGGGEIGDLVWNDLNVDGLQSAGESGIYKAKVVLRDAAGSVVGVQWTGMDGRYLFQSLCAGKYEVSVDVTASGMGFVPTLCNVGPDDTLDSECSPVWVTLATSETVDHTTDFGFHVPEPYEGCSHGYWKNHTSNWPSSYGPNTLFSDVFEDALPGYTLLAALKQGGGGINALGRETVAALLNAASTGVSFPYTPEDVIQRFNAVHPGTKTEYNQLKDEFESGNTLGCPLN